MVSLFRSLFANNLDLDGTRVYAVVTRSFAAHKLLITHCHYVCVTERYTETLHVKKVADLQLSCGKFIMLLTFELEKKAFNFTAFPAL